MTHTAHMPCSSSWELRVQKKRQMQMRVQM
jgi:hypothetical protein